MAPDFQYLGIGVWALPPHHPFIEKLSPVIPSQAHTINFSEALHQKSYPHTDGLWCFQHSPKPLGVKTADCAPVAVISKERYGIFHVGWRGLHTGFIFHIKKLFEKDTAVKAFIGPFLPRFSIKRDYCYTCLSTSFPEAISEKEQNLTFHFQKALAKALSPLPTFWHPKNTLQAPFVSWRAQKTPLRNITLIAPLTFSHDT